MKKIFISLLVAVGIVATFISISFAKLARSMDDLEDAWDKEKEDDDL